MMWLVCGGREYADREFLYAFLDSLLPTELTHGRVTHLIHGDARGADKLAHGWAVARLIQPVRCPALWEELGPRAGALRNEMMLKLNPDLVIAFPGGDGTAHMVRLALKKGTPVRMAVQTE